MSQAMVPGSPAALLFVVAAPVARVVAPAWLRVRLLERLRVRSWRLAGRLRVPARLGQFPARPAGLVRTAAPPIPAASRRPVWARVRRADRPAWRLPADLWLVSAATRRLKAGGSKLEDGRSPGSYPQSSIRDPRSSIRCPPVAHRPGTGVVPRPAVCRARWGARRPPEQPAQADQVAAARQRPGSSVQQVRSWPHLRQAVQGRARPGPDPAVRTVEDAYAAMRSPVCLQP